MRTRFPHRGVSALLLAAALVMTFACNGSPTEPGQVSGSEIVSRSQSLELTPGEHSNGGSTEQDPSDDDVLDVSALTVTAPKGTVVLSGLIKDKITRRIISGVAVKVGTTKVISNSSGLYRINVFPGNITIKFIKTGYGTLTRTMSVPRAMRLDVVLVRMPVAVKSITLNDSNVPIGTVVTATVRLTQAAPSGGATIALSSASPAIATVSASTMTIAAGATSKTFKVTAKDDGVTKIIAKYNKTSDDVTLTVTGETPPLPPVVTGPPVARFTVVYGSDGKCAVIANPDEPPPLIAACTFNAGSSDAPVGSKYTWTFPGNNVFPNRTSSTISNVPLTCGSLPNGVLFERTVELTVTAPNGQQSTISLDVKFKKSGLC